MLSGGSFETVAPDLLGMRLCLVETKRR
ncbi:MAG: hypothetical protein K0R61_2309, partial [Microvirga sp.]|nr:hypothetical protein [Microvirga sp.]